MKVVALEEHFATEQTMAAWRALRPDLQDIAVRQSTGSDVERRLVDLGPERIELMDKAGIQVQVLPLTTPGVQSLDASEAVSLARDTNDVIADTIRAHPNRFQGFATVATPDAIEAVRELDRAIRHLRLHGAMLCGRTRDRNLDDVEFLPIFEAASALNVLRRAECETLPKACVILAYRPGFRSILFSISLWLQYPD